MGEVMGELDDLCDEVVQAIGIPAWEVNTVGACDALVKIRNRAENAESALAIALDDIEFERGRVAGIEISLSVVSAELRQAQEELSKAQADSRALAGLWRGSDNYTFTTSAAPRGLTKADLKALEKAVDSVRELQDGEVVALLRRALGLGGA